MTEPVSNLKLLARVRDITGQIIRLKPFSTVDDLSVTDSRIVLKVSVAAITETKRITRVTKRGSVLYVWNLVDTTWVADQPFAVWWSTDETYDSRERL
jgi:hypothetical protein